MYWPLSTYVFIVYIPALFLSVFRFDSIFFPSLSPSFSMCIYIETLVNGANLKVPICFVSFRIIIIIRVQRIVLFLCFFYSSIQVSPPRHSVGGKRCFQPIPLPFIPFSHVNNSLQIWPVPRISALQTYARIYAYVMRHNLWCHLIYTG